MRSENVPLNRDHVVILTTGGRYLTRTQNSSTKARSQHLTNGPKIEASSRRSLTSALRHLCDDSVLLESMDPPMTPSRPGLVIQNPFLTGYPVDRAG